MIQKLVSRYAGTKPDPELVYQPLATPTTIRIATIPVGVSDDEQFNIKLHHEELSSAKGTYIALSYLWGSSDKPHTIRVEYMGGYYSLKITSSLMSFLRERFGQTPMKEDLEPDGTLRFWIDAICIDQKDLGDKESAIPHMKHIFEYPRHVHAELGLASSSEQKFLDSLEDMAESVEQTIIESRAKNDGVLMMSDIHVPHIDPLDEQFWRGSTAILLNPWWRRVWIKQEVTGDAPVKVYCGKGHVSLFSFYQLDLILYVVKDRLSDSVYEQLGLTRDYLMPLFRIQNIRKTGGRRAVFYNFLRYFRALECSLRHDIIYAATNLATDLKPHDIPINYQQSLQSLFQKVAVHLMKSLPLPLDMLGDAGEISVAYPSWVPQWHLPTSRRPFEKMIIENDTEIKAVYNASGWGKPGESLEWSSFAQIDGNELCLKGFIIDSVEYSHPPLHLVGWADAIELLSSWAPKKKGVYAHSEQTLREVFLRTLVGDAYADLYSSGTRFRDYAALWNDRTNKLDPGTNYESFRQVVYYCNERTLAMTWNGYMLLCPSTCQKEDKIAVLYGGSVLYMLRPKDDKFQLIGECYVHGLMDGEALKLPQSRNIRDIRLI